MAEAPENLSAQSDFLCTWHEERIPFNRVIGLQVETLPDDFFRARSIVMRTGNKLAVTRMEFFHNQEILIDFDSGTYIVG